MKDDREDASSSSLSLPLSLSDDAFWSEEKSRNHIRIFVIQRVHDTATSRSRFFPREKDEGHDDVLFAALFFFFALLFFFFSNFLLKTSSSAAAASTSFGEKISKKITAREEH